MSDATPRSLTILGPPPVQVNLTCYGFHLWAEDLLAAACAYRPVARQGAKVAECLCCQSIELALKAFLSLRGCDRQTLRRRPFGHNLLELARKARELNCGDFFELTNPDFELLRTANEWYDTPGGKRLHYFDIGDAGRGFAGAPPFEAVSELAARLQSPTLRQAVLDA